MAALMTSAIWYRNGVWLDGTPFLPADDAGLVYGAVITDRVRTFRHRPFRLDDHIHRFRTSCELACVSLPPSDLEIHDLVQQLVATNTDKNRVEVDFSIVMLATPGPMGDAGPPTFMIHTMPLEFASYQPMFQRGAHLAIPTIHQIPRTILDPAIKHRSRLHWWIANQQAKQVDATADALLLDDDGCITETASANVIVVKDEELFTPPTETVLRGISLHPVCEMCSENGWPVTEKKLRPDDCYAADEILLTCTSWCTAGVSQLNGKPIPWPGPVYQKLSRLWSERIGVDYVDQILKAKS